MHLDFALPVNGDLEAGIKRHDKKSEPAVMDYSYHVPITEWTEKVSLLLLSAYPLIVPFQRFQHPCACPPIQKSLGLLVCLGQGSQQLGLQVLPDEAVPAPPASRLKLEIFHVRTEHCTQQQLEYGQTFQPHRNACKHSNSALQNSLPTPASVADYCRHSDGL